MTQKTPTEHQEQCAVFEWAALNESKYPGLDMLFATMNGAWLAGRGKQTYALVAKYKAAGLRKGVLDIYLDVARQGYHGLRIEMKRIGKRNKPNEDQERWLNRLAEQGYFACVCWGADQAIEVLKWYLS